MDIKELLLTSSVSTEQSACLWDYNTLNPLKVYKNGGVISAKSLEIIGQDYILASELEKPVINIWALNCQECSKNSRLILPGPATCLTLCPRSLYLVAGISCKVYIWQISSGKLLTVFQKNYQPVTAVKFSSDGDYLVIAGQDGIIAAYHFAEVINSSNSFLTQTDIGQIEPIYTKTDHFMPVNDLHIGNFGRKSYFATVSSDQTCRIYKLANGELILTLMFNQMLTAVHFDAQYWRLFTGDAKGDIYQFNLKQLPGSATRHIDKKNCVCFEGHARKITCIALNITNTVMASGSDDNSVHLWDVKSKQVLKRIEHKGPVTNIKFTLAYENFFIQKLKAQIFLKTLERSCDATDTNLKISHLQTSDINIPELEDCLDKEHASSDLLRSNIRLRCINRQLYNAALEITRKYNNGEQIQC